jgi:hypothetical protein
MPRARLTIAAAARPAGWFATLALAGALLLSGCGAGGSGASASPGAGTPPPTPAAASTASTPPPTPPAAAGSATPTAGPSISSSPAPSPTGCASLAASTFVRLTAVRPAAGGALTLTGNPAKLICGGPDDLHYDVSKRTVTGLLTAGADVQVFPAPPMHLVTLKNAKLAKYLAHDYDTRIFLVTGPLTQITGLTEQYHP